MTPGLALAALLLAAPALPEADAIRLAEAFRIGEELGDRVWRDWSKAPFAVLLVTPEHEYLVRHPNPSPDFAPLGRDATLGADVFVRKRAHATDLLATFPAIAGSQVATIVVGQAELTAKRTSTPWIVTVLHEHFHQLQYSQPDYYRNVEKLDLAGGDTSGMWMLDYPFPYGEPGVKRRFDFMARKLADALTAVKSELSAKAAAYRQARRDFRKSLTPADDRYFTFQLWQEGVARYTEIRVARLAATKYKPTPRFLELSDATSFEQLAEDLEARVAIELSTLELDKYRRVAFYLLGAGDALLLDRLKEKWQDGYLKVPGTVFPSD